MNKPKVDKYIEELMSLCLYKEIRDCRQIMKERKRRIKAEAQLVEANDEIVALHNPHTGNECDCTICDSYGKRGER